jgi:hypothetical protein
VRKGLRKTNLLRLALAKAPSLNSENLKKYTFMARKSTGNKALNIICLVGKYISGRVFAYYIVFSI